MQIDGRKNNGPREGIRNGGSPRKITDDELREACKVMSRMEIAKKYDMHPESLARRMHRLGVHALLVKQDGSSVFRNTGNRKRGLQGPKVTEWHQTPGTKKLVDERHPNFEYVSYFNKRIRMRCKECGAVIERALSTVKGKGIRCENCQAIKELEQERKRLVNVLSNIISSKTPKVCPTCGVEFYSPRPTAVYCSSECKRKHRGSSSIRGRCRKYRTPYQTGITLPQLYRRDGGICQICGKPTDWNDRRWTEYCGPLYPTIDHKIALANGGGHTWDNVQLAHAICNSYKRDT